MDRPNMDGECRSNPIKGKEQLETLRKSEACSVDNNLSLAEQESERIRPKKRKFDDLPKLGSLVMQGEKALHEEDNYDHVQSGLVYVASSFPGLDVMKGTFVECIRGCECGESSCGDGCACVLQYGCPYESGRLRECFYKRPVFECNDMCFCGDECTSRVVQRGPVVGLRILSLPRKGYGVVTSHFIPKGSFVCEYAGEYISSREASLRFAQQTDEDSNYILVLREHVDDASLGPITTIIDPTVVGNIGRYVNHSCDPNMMVVPVRINFMHPLAALFAVRDILPGEELCYDYSYTVTSGDLLSQETPLQQKDAGYILEASGSKHNTRDKCKEIFPSVEEGCSRILVSDRIPSGPGSSIDGFASSISASGSRIVGVDQNPGDRGSRIAGSGSSVGGSASSISDSGSRVASVDLNPGGPGPSTGDSRYSNEDSGMSIILHGLGKSSACKERLSSRALKPCYCESWNCRRFLPAEKDII